VDLSEPDFRTLLLGMKPNRTYHARVVAEHEGRECASAEFTLLTGPLPPGLPSLSNGDAGNTAPTPGFVVSSFLLNGPAFILDADGDYVWSYGSGEIGRAALSPDGKYLWYASVNVAGGGGSMKRVTLDGLEEQDLSAEFGEIHHDFTILPDRSVAFLQHDGDLDRVVERAPDGTQRVAFSVSEVAGGAAPNHANSLRYWLDDESYTVSDLAHNAYMKVSRTGDLDGYSVERRATSRVTERAGKASTATSSSRRIACSSSTTVRRVERPRCSRSPSTSSRGLQIGSGSTRPTNAP
jgi:hypothetical protein